MRKCLLVSLLLINGGLIGQVDSVLFIGNSYTYANNLPEMFRQLGLSAGDTFFVDAVSLGGYTIQDHVSNTAHIATIEARNWDAFFIQEQSQIPTIDFYFQNWMLAGLTSLYPSLVYRNECAKIFLFMTWGRRFGGQQCDVSGNNCSVNFADFEHMQDTLRSRYMQAAAHIGGSVSPAGEAWRIALRDTTGLVLHTSDNSHANAMGTYLAACTHYASLTGTSPHGLSYTANVSPGWADYLQRKAAEAVLDSFAVYGIGSQSYPSLDMTVQAGILPDGLFCEPQALPLDLSLAYKGLSLADSLRWVFFTYGEDGNLLRTDTIHMPTPAQCAESQQNEAYSLPIDSSFHHLIYQVEWTNGNATLVERDTLAVFQYTIDLREVEDAYQESFTTREFTSMYDRWKAEKDTILNNGWTLEQDATLQLGQLTFGAPGCAMAELGGNSLPQNLVSPCMDLYTGGAYEVSFRHANHSQDPTSQLGFRLMIDTSAAFSFPNTIRDFGVRYDPLFQSFKDTIEVTFDGLYYLGIQAYSNGVTDGMLGIDDFQVRKINSVSSVNIEDDFGEKAEQLFRLSPNPADQQVQITLSASLAGSHHDREIRLFDLFGRPVYAIPAGQHLTTIQVGELAAGIYHCVIVEKGQIIGSQPMVIRH